MLILSSDDWARGLMALEAQRLRDISTPQPMAKPTYIDYTLPLSIYDENEEAYQRAKIKARAERDAAIRSPADGMMLSSPDRDALNALYGYTPKVPHAPKAPKAPRVPKASPASPDFAREWERALRCMDRAAMVPRPVTIPRRIRQDAALLAPASYLIGIEFEGMIRDTAYSPIIDGLNDLIGQDDNGDDILQFGNDPSIKDVPAYFTPVEIRTATLPLARGLEVFEHMLCFLYLCSETNDWRTNGSCGLHLNLSEEGVFDGGEQKAFYLDLLTRFDERTVLSRFQRLGNRYCLPFWSDQYAKPDSVEAARERYDAVKAREKAAIAKGDSGRASRESKYFACALRDSPAHPDYDGDQETANRIEFRCIGNEGYHLRFDDLEVSVNHMLDSVFDARDSVVSAASAAMLTTV